MAETTPMNWEAVAAISQLVGTIGVIITLIFLAVQVRANTRVANAQARQSISEFVLRIAIFRAEHADRFAKLDSGAELTAGDHQFRYWSHIQFLLHAEMYFHHHALGLIPDAHWRPYARYWAKYVKGAGFKEVWDDIGPDFSEDFARWVDAMLVSHLQAR
jgi:hypothetical protein